MKKNFIKSILAILLVILNVSLFSTFARADEPGEYLLKVNRVANCITAYQKDENGEFTKAYKAMACSVGADINTTPVGEFAISDKYDWRKMKDATFSQFCCRILDNILIGSVPFRNRANDTMDVMEFNKLGEGATSTGCIRLSVLDAKWIFDSCAPGTKVIIYDDETSPGPIGKPDTFDIPTNSEFINWDPTDPNPNNPWNTKAPQITGAEDKTVDVGEQIDLMDGVLGIDTCGNEGTDYIKIEGEYDFDEPGEYAVKYVLTDLTGRTAEAPITLTVKGEKKTTQEIVENTSDKYDETTQYIDVAEETTPYVVYEEKEKGDAGVGTVMTIIIIAVVSFIIVSFVVKRK